MANRCYRILPSQPVPNQFHRNQINWRSNSAETKLVKFAPREYPFHLEGSSEPKRTMKPHEKFRSYLESEDKGLGSWHKSSYSTRNSNRGCSVHPLRWGVSYRQR